MAFERGGCGDGHLIDKSGEEVNYVFGEQWRSVGGENDPRCNEETTYAKEFRYDSPRQRYLVRTLDPVQAQAGNLVTHATIPDEWSDYSGDTIYGDWQVAGWGYDTRAFQPGLARTDRTVDPPVTRYEHTDLLGTSKMDTLNDLGGPSAPRETYTAFGERVCSLNNSCPEISPFDRYGYVGVHGYQADKDFPFLHVGARYYDPGSGRFLQRDPSGIADGSNVYAYLHNSPTSAVDPSGLYSIDDFFADAGDAVAVIIGAGSAIVAQTPGAVKGVGATMITAGTILAGVLGAAHFTYRNAETIGDAFHDALIEQDRYFHPWKYPPTPIPPPPFQYEIVHDPNRVEFTVRPRTGG